MSTEAQIARVLVAAFAFGLLAAWLARGQGAYSGQGIPELRNVLGNLSTPWLLVAFVAGTRCFTLRAGALFGLAATLVALGSFYLLSSIVQDLGGHGFFGDLRLELSANRGYFQGGLITGLLFGALGAWWRQRRRLHASIVAGALLMAEPLVFVLLEALGPGHVLPSDSGVPTVVRILPGSGLAADASPIAIGVYVVEFVLGLGVIFFAAIGLPKWRRSRATHLP